MPIGKHQAVANMTSRMAAETFAMESINWLACALADKGGVDIRLEAAMAKYFCTEAGWRVGDDFMQVRGGRGYESFDSLRNRDEEPVVCERTMRDARVSRILEGTSEIMQLIIAREATDMHMSKVMPIMNPKTPMGQKISMAFKAAFFYATWLPTTFLPAFAPAQRQIPVREEPRPPRRSWRAAASAWRGGFSTRWPCTDPSSSARPSSWRASSTSARTSTPWPPACPAPRALLAQDPSNKTINDVVDLFCRIARRRIKNNFKLVWDRSHDNLIDKVGKEFLEGQLSWMVDGVYTDVPPKK